MKRNSKIVIAAVSAIAITTGALATGTLAFAEGGRGDRMVNRLTERLELSADQSTALETLQVEMKETRELMRGDAAADGQTLQDLIVADTFDQGAALEMITSRAAALQAQGPELVAAAAVFLDGLSVDQKAQLSELMDRSSKRGGGRKSRSE